MQNVHPNMVTTSSVNYATYSGDEKEHTVSSENAVKVVAVNQRENELSENISLQARNQSDVPSLDMALLNGNYEMVKAEIEAIRYWFEYKLISKEDAVSLLKAQYKGIPGLFLALRNGHSETVKVYIDEIRVWLEGKLISKEDAVSLLQALWNGKPGLFIALENGRDKTVNAYIDGVAYLAREEAITKQSAVFLLKAQYYNYFMGVMRLIEFNALDIARKNGHTSTVQVFNDGIRGLVEKKVLSDEQATSILSPSFF